MFRFATSQASGGFDQCWLVTHKGPMNLGQWFPRGGVAAIAISVAAVKIRWGLQLGMLKVRPGGVPPTRFGLAHPPRLAMLHPRQNFSSRDTRHVDGCPRLCRFPCREGNPSVLETVETCGKAKSAATEGRW